jgi:TonB family protein
VEGDVLMEVVIGPDGTVGDVRILRPLEPGLDANALQAVRNWRFQPTIKDGEPVAVRVQIGTSFRLM